MCSIIVRKTDRCHLIQQPNFCLSIIHIYLSLLPALLCFVLLGRPLAHYKAEVALDLLKLLPSPSVGIKVMHHHPNHVSHALRAIQLINFKFEIVQCKIHYFYFQSAQRNLIEKVTNPQQFVYSNGIIILCFNIQIVPNNLQSLLRFPDWGHSWYYVARVKTATQSPQRKSLEYNHGHKCPLPFQPFLKLGISALIDTHISMELHRDPTEMPTHTFAIPGLARCLSVES